MENLSVIHFASYFNTNRLYRELFDELSNAGIRQQVLSPRAIDSNKINGCNFSISNGEVWTPLDRILFNRKLRRYREFADKNVDVRDFELLHAHSLYSDGILVSEIAAQTCQPFCVAVRSTDVNWFAKYRPDLSGRAIKVLQQAKNIIFINNHDRYRVEQALNHSIDSRRVITIPNGVHDDWLQDPVNVHASSKQVINILSTAKVTKTKNHVALIHAVNKANSIQSTDGPLIKLSIAGNLESNYGKKLRDKYQSGSINFLGLVDRETLKNTLCKSDVFALVSIRETFGISYAQALSQGVPILFTKGQGFDGWPGQDQWGTAHDLNDPDSLVDFLLALKKRVVPNFAAVSTCRELFNWKTIASGYVDIYQQCKQKNS